MDQETMDHDKTDPSSDDRRDKRSVASKLAIRLGILLMVAAGLAVIFFWAVEPRLRELRGQRQSALAESLGATSYAFHDSNHLEMINFTYFPPWLWAMGERGKAIPPTHIDVSQVSGFSKLERLSFVNCHLDSISELKKLKQLSYLELYDCSIDNLDPEVELAITTLYYEGSDSLLDFPQLPNVKSIEIGRLIDCPGSRQDLNRTPDRIWPGENSQSAPLPPDICLDFDFAELGRFTSVERISIYNKDLGDFRGCERLQQLKSIRLLACRAKSLDGLADLQALESIYMNEHFILGDSSERRKMTAKEAEEMLKTLQQCKSLKGASLPMDWYHFYDMDRLKELLPGVKKL